MNGEEIQVELARLRTRLFDLRSQVVTVKVEDTSQFRKRRRHRPAADGTSGAAGGGGGLNGGGRPGGRGALRASSDDAAERGTAKAVSTKTGGRVGRARQDPQGRGAVPGEAPQVRKYVSGTVLHARRGERTRGRRVEWPRAAPSAPDVEAGADRGEAGGRGGALAAAEVGEGWERGVARAIDQWGVNPMLQQETRCEVADNSGRGSPT